MITRKKQNKPKHTCSYTYIPIYLYHVNPVNPVKKIFLRNEANSTFLYPCILAFLYSCFAPNKANFIPSYPSVLSVAKNMILQNKPNFPIFDLKTRAVAKNKPNSTFLNPCILASLYTWILPNEPNFSLFLLLLSFAFYLFTYSPNEAKSPCILP